MLLYFIITRTYSKKKQLKYLIDSRYITQTYEFSLDGK